MFSLDCSLPGQVRIDPITNHQGKVRFLVVQNRSSQPVQVRTDSFLRGSGVFSGLDWSSGKNIYQDLPPKFIDFINIRDNAQ